MKFSAAAIGAVVSAIVATASPIHHKREVGGILMCTGANATGTCSYKVYSMETCHQLPKPYFENINTFAPDGEAFSCYPRAYSCGGICTSPEGCTVGAVDFDWEYKYNLSAVEWTTLFKSFDCALKSNTTSS